MQTYSQISRDIQKQQLKGKKGLRDKVGYYKSDGSIEFQDKDMKGLHIKTNSPTLYNISEILSTEIILKAHPRYDKYKFVRALYYLGFNLLAYTNYDMVMDEKYNALRNYIRKAKTRELWNVYPIDILNKDEINLNSVNFNKIDTPHGEFLKLQILTAYFILDLENKGTISLVYNELNITT